MTSSSHPSGNVPPGRAIVTGAARGIGAAAVAILKQRGYDVIALDREWPASVADDSRTATVDLQNPRALEEFVSGVVSAGEPISVLVNNAAVTIRGPLAGLRGDDIDLTLNVDLRAPLHLCRLLIPAMVAGSSIVNVTSVRATRGFANDAAYIAAKGGLEALTRAMAVELGPSGIRANAVAPGIIATDMNRTTLDDADVRARLTSQVPLNRLGTPDDVAQAIGFLVSPAAEYVSGIVLTVDGGWSAGK